jgi:chromate transporter
MAGTNAPLMDREFASLGDLAKAFLILGTTAFGGPAVHFGMYQARFIDQDEKDGKPAVRKWLSNERYMELFGMASCLPGPSSTQVAFAIGVTQQGVIGGLVAGFAFLLPGFFGMTGLGFLAHQLKDQVKDPHSVTSGVAQACSCVGVALVFKAVTDLVVKCGKTPGPKTSAICVLVAATCMLVSPAPPYLNPLLIFLGGMATIASPLGGAAANKELPAGGKVGLGVYAGLFIFLLYFLMTPVCLWMDGQKDADGRPYVEVMGLNIGWLAAFLTAGMFVWGGGPVVLPMLMIALVDPNASSSAELGHGFVSATVFLTGIAIAEMMPGPVFNMSCFLGVQIALNLDFPWVLGTVLAWACLVGPGVGLTFGAMPLWDKLRSNAWYKKALPGLNAAAVGLLLSTLFVVYNKLEARAAEMHFVNQSRALVLLAYAFVSMQSKSADHLVPLVVLVAAALGVAWAMYAPKEDAAPQTKLNATNAAFI